MASEGAPGGPTAGPIKDYEALYDRHRFLDLYASTSSYWNSATEIGSLPLDALILGARSAHRLGGQRLGRWLMREAMRRAPSNPKVRYFSRNFSTSRDSLLDELKDFNADPDLGGEDAGLRASWYASFAWTFAVLRDLDRAYDCLRTAHAIAPNDSYVLHLESAVHGQADRWTEALRSAERALEVDPGAPFAVFSLGASLINLGRVEESAARTFGEAASSQSYETVLWACWHQCALAEILDGDERRAALDRARGLASRLPGLMPLADRESRKLVARSNLDIAELADDYAGIERWSAEVRSPFHRQLLANLARNAEGKRLRLPFRRTIQKHNACVPASIAAAMSAGGMTVSEDAMAAEITFGGTQEWAAADWLRERGFHVRFFFATPDVAARLIRARIAFIFCWEADESGHAVAAVGLDERAETLLVHDPNSFRGTEYLLSVLNDLASPLGFKGMAVVRPEKAAELDALLPPESAVMAAAQEHAKQMRLHGPSASRPVVADVLARFPSHPGSEDLVAAQALEDGQIGQALGKLKGLLRRFPKAPLVRVQFMAACEALGNTALMRQALKDIVEAGRLPGLEAQQDWIYPPDRYVYEYADLLRLSADTRRRAGSLLLKLIRRQPVSAGAWHNLADLLWDTRDRPGALLAYRIASCLADSHEHYARAYADALAADRREEEAFRWLEARARRFRNAPHAAGTWVTWISALEDRGHPERALAACDEALGPHSASAELLSFAVPFFARMGHWARAGAELERLRGAGLPYAFFEASTRLDRMRGDLESAARDATAWVAELPRYMEARRNLLDVIGQREGPEAAVRISRQWMLENGGHEDFEEAYCAQLDRASAPPGKKYAVLLRRLERNPEDGWAWHELTFTCLREYAIADDRRRKRLEPRLARYLAECDRTSAGSVPTLRAQALWSEVRGDWAAAVDLSLGSIALDPETPFSYRRAWECSSRLKAEERQGLWDRIEPMFLNATGRLSIAREVAGLVAVRFGIAAAEKSVAGWRAARPDDPDILEAAAALLIEYGHGRSDAARAVDLLEPAVLRYPYHSGLRFTLAHPYHRPGHHADAEAVLVEIMRRLRDCSSAKIQLAWIRSRAGDKGGAYDLLDQATAAEPRSSETRDARAQILIEHARYDEAVKTIEEGLTRLPLDARWRDRAVSLLVQCGAPEKAIQAARGGVEADPRNGYLWGVLGRTLNDFRHYAEVGEIESCLRKGLALDAGLFEAADRLACLLTEQRRYDDASKIMLDIEPRLTDPSPARGRLAWIRRQSGQKPEAVDEMAKALEAFPWYSWGWYVLMDWLEEDAAWDRARDLLHSVPPPLATDPAFRLRRLRLLEKATPDGKPLDEEWARLLGDFPEDVTLHVTRYDVLCEALRWPDAAAVIEAIAKVEPNEPFVLARHCEVLSRDLKKVQAREIALRIFFRPADEYTWPADKAWEVARRGDFADSLSFHFRERLRAGDKPTPQAFTGLVAYAMRNAKKRALKGAPSAWFPGEGAREMIRLVDDLSKVPWDGSQLRAVVYSALCDYGYNRLVTKLSARFGPGAVTAVAEWAEIARAHISGHQASAGRRVLGDWRERTGVAMWMVTNYVLALSRARRDQLQERYRSARDALAGLPHDHCAKYLAHVQAEACALLGDKDAFLETWATHTRYFDGQVGSGEFFKGGDRRLLTSIPKLADALTREGERPARNAFLRFRLRRKLSFGTRPRPEREASPNLTPLFWIIVLILPALIRVIGGLSEPSNFGLGDGGPDYRQFQPAPRSPQPGGEDRRPTGDRAPGGATDPLSLAVSHRDLVTKVTRLYSQGGTYGATVEVTNRGDKTYHFVMVKVEFLDRGGRVVYTLMTEARSDKYILPGRWTSFEVKGAGKLDYATARASVVYATEAK